MLPKYGLQIIHLHPAIIHRWVWGLRQPHGPRQSLWSRKIRGHSLPKMASCMRPMYSLRSVAIIGETAASALHLNSCLNQWISVDFVAKLSLFGLQPWTQPKTVDAPLATHVCSNQNNGLKRCQQYFCLHLLTSDVFLVKITIRRSWNVAIAIESPIRANFFNKVKWLKNGIN